MKNLIGVLLMGALLLPGGCGSRDVPKSVDPKERVTVHSRNYGKDVAYVVERFNGLNDHYCDLGNDGVLDVVTTHKSDGTPVRIASRPGLFTSRYDPMFPKGAQGDLTKEDKRKFCELRNDHL